MTSDTVAQLTSQLDAVITECWAAMKNPHPMNVQRAMTRAMAAVERIGGRPSRYVNDAEVLLSHADGTAQELKRLTAIAEALRADLGAGYIQTFRELVHADVFGDYLDMASYFVDRGHKDAAAVIAGSTLEAHLRKLCIKQNIEPDVKKAKGQERMKASRMNAELHKVSAYSSGNDHRSVDTWLGLRNYAAHGDYQEYTREQVSGMVDGIRDFITRNPA